MAPPDFVPPTEAKETEDGGRTVVATRDIQKGEVVYKKTTNLAYFSSGYGYSFQHFLGDLLDFEACDFMKFSWPQENFGPNGESAIVWPYWTIIHS
ncbi:hypothetical protein ACHAWT_000788 [Skeletonema menzelii]